MRKSIIFPFINKAIDNTKNGKLSWHLLNDHQSLCHLRPTPPDNTFNCTSSTSLGSKNEDVINFQKSYYTSFKNGYIFLFCINSSDPFTVSGINEKLSLQVQEGSYAVEIVNSSVSTATSTQLKRLYNLVESNSSNLNGFINDFLNS